MLIALAFAHFSSELLLKEQMIIPVKKTLNNTGHIDAKLIDFSEICQKKSIVIGCFLVIVSWRSFPPKFPTKSADFSESYFGPDNPSKFDFFPLKSREIGPFFCKFWLFSRKNLAKSADFSTNFDFFSAKILQNQPIFPWICPWKSCEILLFFLWNIRSPVIRSSLYLTLWTTS